MGRANAKMSISHEKHTIIVSSGSFSSILFFRIHSVATVYLVCLRLLWMFIAVHALFSRMASSVGLHLVDSTDLSSVCVGKNLFFDKFAGQLTQYTS